MFKAAMKQWVRAVRDERGKGPWVSAIRPGVAGIAEAVRTRHFLTAEESAEIIWSSIPDDFIAEPVLLFGEAVGVTTSRRARAGRRASPSGRRR